MSRTTTRSSERRMSQRRRLPSLDTINPPHHDRERHDNAGVHEMIERSGSTTAYQRSRSRGGSNPETSPTSETRRQSLHRPVGDRIASAIDPLERQQDLFEDAASLYSISQAPDEESVEERMARRESQRGSSVSKKEAARRPSMSRSRASRISRVGQIVDAIESPIRERETFQDAESLFSIPQPPDEASVQEASVSTPDGKEPPKVYKPMAWAVITSLIPGSIFGVLARQGLLALTNYDACAIFPLAWVQATGCLVMGFALGMRDHIGAYYGPLYTAIATGFCGSLTTFSSWQLDIFLAWANSGHAHRDWFRDVLDGLARTIFTLAVSLSAVTLGVHLSRPLVRRMPRIKPASVFTRYGFRIASILMYIATIPLYFGLSPSFRHQATAALLFSFPGTLTRYILATKLTLLLHLFPLGTFVANVVGTALLGIFYVLQRMPKLPSPNACAILQGLMDGYCGCLTTVSTFAVEVGALKTKRAWLYVLLSWGISQLLLLVILGTAWWGANIDNNRVCTFA